MPEDHYFTSEAKEEVLCAVGVQFIIAESQTYIRETVEDSDFSLNILTFLFWYTTVYQFTLQPHTPPH